MDGRSGLKDFVIALTFVSGVIAISDILSRGKTAIEAKEKHQRTKAQLNSIERKVSKIYDAIKPAK